MKECVVDVDGMVKGGGKVESGDWGVDESMSGVGVCGWMWGGDRYDGVDYG